MHLDLPYHSRRDELGGVIDDNEWNAFTKRLEDVIDKIKRKRKRIIKRRKKRGKKLMPRATLFKPKKRENLDKNPLWKEVFMHQDSDDDGSSDSGAEEEMLNMYQDTLAKRGIKTAGPKKEKNIDLILPPIDAHRTNKPTKQAAPSVSASLKLGAKK